MLYALGSADVATGSYSTTIPQGTNAGTYYVWYKVSADANHIDSVAASLDVTISKANPTVTPPTAKTGLKYDSTAQALVNAGSVQGGTMNYALGDNATTAPTSEYSTTIPTGTNEGAYYVWYKVIGNSNYNDTTAQCIQVTIELESYAISYSGLENSTGTDSNPTSYTIKSDTITLANPTKNGYTFSGWTGTGLSEKTQTVTISQGSTGNRSYTANWNIITYKISFDLGGGEFSGENPLSYTYESSDIKPNTPTKEGYDFKGWLLSGDESGTVSKDLTIPNGTTGDLEYIAQWTLHFYTLSYDLDGGTVTPENPKNYTIESNDINLNRPTKTGYDFRGWSFDAEISLDVTIPKGSTGDREYKAEWNLITYSISYDLQGGSVTTANPTSYDVTTETFKLTNPTRTGYTFAGWTGTGITGTSTDVTILTGTTGNRDYTATWTAIEYTISYTLNNGSVSGNPTSYTIETETFTLNKPSRNGYQFDGWTGTDLSGKTQTVTITQGTIGNRSYTANFSPIEYTITYELNGGTNNADNPTSYTIESATITLKAPTRNAYNFSGWTLNGEAISEIAHGSTGNKTLTATWGETKPIISPASYALTVYKGQSSSLTLNATGTNLEWSISGSLPAGMTFSNTENSATISGTPELGTSGSYAITVTASNAGGSASANVTLTIASDFALSGDVEAGTPATITPEGGGSQTTTQTVFRNGAGQTILTADVAITTESEDFEAIVGSAFTTTVKVDVTLNVADSDYDGYEYSMSITGLPEWLKAEGELESTDMLEVGESTHSHEFTLTGTPTVSSDAETLNLTATVKVSGETPMLEASGSKEVKISVTSPEHIPEILQSLSVKISGDETLITDAGTSASITFTADVKGLYSNGQTRTLPSGGYALTWSASNVEGLSLSDGTLRVGESAAVGTHDIQITATAVSGDITGTDTKTVTITVRNVAPKPAVPVLTCATPSMTVKKGGTIASLTVRSDITPSEWLPSGELPEGLSGRSDGDKFVISGTVSSNSETRSYVYAVRARNEAGMSEAMTITITVTGTGSVTPDYVEVPAGEIHEMTDEEITETFADTTNIVLTGEVTNITETIARLESLTDVKTLDLSLITGISELKLENTTLESITLEGNQSITKVEINGNETLTALNLGGSKVETVDAEGCKRLTSINVERAENLTALNVKETAITELNANDCTRLEMVDAKGCENLSEVNLEGCESLEYLDVSETAITELDVRDCVNLGTLYCASCDIEDLNFEGCENLETLDCSNNGLLMLNASGLKNLRYLECRHQRAIKPLSRLMNFIDFLFGRGSFGASAADEGADGDLTSYLANVKNLKAYDEAGEEITTEYDPATGEARFSATPYKITYDYDTGFEDVMMDVEVTASESNDKGYAGIGSPGGGCTSVEGIGALVALMMLLVPTSKTKFMK